MSTSMYLSWEEAEDCKSEDSLYSTCNDAFQSGCRETLLVFLGHKLVGHTAREVDLLVDKLFDIKTSSQPLMIRLINQKLQMDIIDAAVVLGNLDIFRILIPGVRFQNMQLNYLNPLHWMGISPCVDKETIRKIILQVMKVIPYCLLQQTAKGYSPLHITSKYGKNIVVLESFLEAGSSINSQTLSGFTALHFCCQSNATQTNRKEEMLHALLQHGADLSLRSMFDSTVAETIAQNYESIHLLKVLLRYGLTKDMLGKQFSSFRMERHLMRHPKSWDIIIPLVEIGYSFQFSPSFSNKSSQRKVRELQREVTTLQRQTSNAIRLCLHPGFYPKLYQLTCLPNCLKEYIMLDDVLSI